MKLKNVFFVLTAISIISTPAQSLSLNFIKRGFKHCTGVCDSSGVCNDGDKVLWCILNCDHKEGMLGSMTKQCASSSQFRATIVDLRNNMSKLSKKESQKVQTFINQQEKVIFGEASMPPQMAPPPLSGKKTPPPVASREGRRALTPQMAPSPLLGKKTPPPPPSREGRPPLSSQD